MALGRNGHSEKKTEQETTFWSVCRPKKSLKLGILCMENLAEFKSSLWCSVSFSFKKKKKNDLQSPLRKRKMSIGAEAGALDTPSSACSLWFLLYFCFIRGKMCWEHNLIQKQIQSFRRSQASILQLPSHISAQSHRRKSTVKAAELPISPPGCSPNKLECGEAAEMRIWKCFHPERNIKSLQSVEKRRKKKHCRTLCGRQLVMSEWIRWLLSVVGLNPHVTGKC